MITSPSSSVIPPRSELAPRVRRVPSPPWLGRGLRAALAGFSVWLVWTWVCVQGPGWCGLAGTDGRPWPGGLEDALDGVIGLSSILLLTWWTRCLDSRSEDDAG
jgi:hypothetical protein